jgi:hypothetical protein
LSIVDNNTIVVCSCGGFLVYFLLTRNKDDDNNAGGGYGAASNTELTSMTGGGEFATARQESNESASFNSMTIDVGGEPVYHQLSVEKPGSEHDSGLVCCDVFF